MSHKPDADKVGLSNITSPETPCAPHSFVLADYGPSGPVEVELVDYRVSIEEPQFEALVADSQCEV